MKNYGFYFRIIKLDILAYISIKDVILADVQIIGLGLGGLINGYGMLFLVKFVIAICVGPISIPIYLFKKFRG